MKCSIHWFRAVRDLLVWLLLSLPLPQAAQATTDTWSPAANMTTAREWHTSTLLTDGRTLVVGGRSGNTSLASAELYDPASNTWSSAGNLATERRSHTATLLPSGMVLVVGGFSSIGTLSSAELYDPTSNTWSSTGSLAIARQIHTAILLPSGQVLVAAGYGPAPPPSPFLSALAGAELYDPVSKTWSSAGRLTTARYLHTATLLPSGKVLVAGGFSSNFGALASAEVYDPASNVWTSTGSLAAARSKHTATLLPSGAVLVAGGANDFSSDLSSVELYDPASHAWSSVGNLTTSRYWHTATLLPSGKVIVAGGYSNINNAVRARSVEVYDPATSTWSSVANLATGRYRHTVILLPSGKLLVAAGANKGGDDNDVALASAEFYDPARNTWDTAGSLATARRFHNAVLLPSGKVLVTGGRAGDYDASVELYDPANNTWNVAASLSTARVQHTTTLLPSGKVLVAGGFNEIDRGLASAELYDPVNNTWSSAGSLPTFRAAHTATLLPTGKVLIAGGSNNSAELYDTASNTWSAAGRLTTIRTGHTATLLPSGKVLIVGGYLDGGGCIASTELYDPASNTWSAANNLSVPRYSHTATLLPSGKVLIAGGLGNGPVNVTSAELYDPASNTWSVAGSLANARSLHTATLLLSGHVFVAGGNGSGGVLASTELYDPTSNTWSAAGNLSTPRISHTGTLLPSGKLLVVAGQTTTGGAHASAELYTLDLGFSDSRRPIVTGTNNPVVLGDRLQLTGTGFTGDSEASGGNSHSSATHSPLVQLRRIDSDQIVWTSPAADSVRSATRYESAPLLNLPGGGYALTLFVNAIPSISQVIMLVPSYIVTPSTNGSGEISPNTPQVVNEGTTTTFTLIPNTGYRISSATGTCGGTLMGTIFTTAPINAACTVIAHFEISTYTLTYAAGTNGTISGISPQTVNHGSNGSAMTAIPDTGYHFVQWSDGSTANPRTDTDVTESISVTASFTTNTYTLTYAAGANGTIGGTSPQTVNHGASGTMVTAIPNTGYHFVQWNDGSTANPRTDANVTESISVTASFAINTYTVTAIASGNGTISPSTQSLSHGGTAHFIVTTSRGHTVEVSGEPCAVTRADDTSWTSDAITSHCVVTATFTATPSLTIAVTDDRDYASYGMLLNYVVTVANAGPGDAAGVSLTNTLPEQLDAAHTTWICQGAGNGAICPSAGSGALNTNSITIPADRTLTWRVTAPALLQAVGSTIEYTVNAHLGDGSTLSATDTDTLVIFRDGFDLPYADGTQGIDSLVTCTRADFGRFDEASLWIFAIPDHLARSAIEMILIARDSHASGFRVEHLNLGAEPRVRLITVAPDGSERASSWAVTATAAPLALATSQTVEGSRMLLLEGAGVPLSVPLPTGIATTLQVLVHASLKESCQ